MKKDTRYDHHQINYDTVSASKLSTLDSIITSRYPPKIIAPYLNHQYNPLTWKLHSSLIFTSYFYHVVKTFPMEQKRVDLQEQVAGEGKVAKKEDQLVWKKLMAGQTAPELSLKEGDL